MRCCCGQRGREQICGCSGWQDKHGPPCSDGRNALLLKVNGLLRGKVTVSEVNFDILSANLALSLAGAAGTFLGGRSFDYEIPPLSLRAGSLLLLLENRMMLIYRYR